MTVMYEEITEPKQGSGNNGSSEDFRELLQQLNLSVGADSTFSKPNGNSGGADISINDSTYTYNPLLLAAWKQVTAAMLQTNSNVQCMGLGQMDTNEATEGVTAIKVVPQTPQVELLTTEATKPSTRPADAKAKAKVSGPVPGEKPVKGSGDESSAATQRRWTKIGVQTLVSEQVEPLLFGAGRRMKKPLSILEHTMVVRLVELLGKYGPMTPYQLRAWIMANGSWVEEGVISISSQTLRVSIQYALQHARYQDLASAISITNNWNDRDRNQKRVGHKTNLWSLKKPGLIFYQMQTRIKSTLAYTAGSAYAQQQEHTFGTQQSVAALNMLCAANRLVALHLKHLKLPPTNTLASPATPTKFGPQIPGPIQMELLPWATSVLVQLDNNSEERLRPDAIGRISLETSVTNPASRNIINALTTQANVAAVVELQNQPQEKQVIANVGLASSTNSERVKRAIEEVQLDTFAIRPAGLAWPFALEYDRATELPQVFAAKYKAYAALYNTSFLSPKSCPQLWQDKFPVILVVTEGDNKHLLDMMLEVRRQVQTSRLQHRLTSWWFTRTEWFKAAYQPYLNETSLAKWEKTLTSSTGQDSTESSTTHITDQAQMQQQTQTARIWVPLSLILVEQAETIVNKGQLNRVSRYLISTNTKSENPSKRAKVGSETDNSDTPQNKAKVESRPPLLSRMCSIPLYHPLNDGSVMSG